MKTKAMTENKGEYDCDIDITVEEWQDILQDKMITSESCISVLLKFYAEPEHKSTCKNLGEKYNQSPQSFNSIITNFAKATQNKLNRFEVLRDDGKPCFWIIPMIGQYQDTYFEWRLRPELVEAIEVVFLNKEYQKFKKLLEYFVTHLEWVVNEDSNSRGYEQYVKPLVEKNKFYKTGQGYTGDNIQAAISDWEEYLNGKVFVNISPNYGDYTTRKCYLNWEETGINIIAHWRDEDIIALSQEHYKFWLDNSPREKITNKIALNTLGLFDDKDSFTNEFKNFYHCFNSELNHFRIQREKEKKMQELKPYIELLETNKNLILTGAPGTGKTYLAKQLADALGESIFVQFHPSYDYSDFVEGLRPVKKNGGELGFELKDGVFKTFCKKALKNFTDSEKPEAEIGKEATARHNIHQFLDEFIDADYYTTNNENENILQLSNGNTFIIYEYDDSHIKVKVPNNAITSELKLPISELIALIIEKPKIDKVKDIRCFFNRSHNRQTDSYIATIYNHEKLNKDLQRNDKSAKVKLKKYVLIIDEINRAEISKVFGELFYSIDAGYRGIDGKVKTQYTNLQDESDVFYDGVYIPKNVYIIGTMNDIDRSVESMDFAMRRRFAWKEVNALERVSMWDDNEDMNEYKDEARQRMIALNTAIEETQMLNSAYHIGPSYFLNLKHYKNSDNPFESLWNNHLQGLICEYLRGQPNAKERMDMLKKAYDLKVNDEN